jgi:hypothetical protein
MMRRAFRRQLRKAGGAQVPPILREANLAFDKGEFGRAAELFEKIAEGADARGGPRAPLFYFQAGRARMLAGQAALGIPSFKRGFSLLAKRKQFPRLQNAGLRLVLELSERGLKNEAREIQDWLNNLMPARSTLETLPPLTKATNLPTHCPQCGAALRPDEVEWMDEVTAECGYCGSPVREEN